MRQFFFFLLFLSFPALAASGPLGPYHNDWNFPCYSYKDSKEFAEEKGGGALLQPGPL